MTSPVVAREKVILTLLGPVPSKKNLWKRGKGGRTYIDYETQALIDSLTIQAATQWGQRAVEHPEITVQLYVLARRQDRDNMLTTLLDCLCGAGVLKNDNIARCNGTMTVLPAVVVKAYERAVVEITGGEEAKPPRGAGRARK